MHLFDAFKVEKDGCKCGREHFLPNIKVICKSGAIQELPAIINQFGAKKVFVFSDKNTFIAGGEKVIGVLQNNKIEYTSYVIQNEKVKPDEKNVGSLIMHFDKSADLVIAVGSGVINDLTKVLCSVANKPFIIVGTAPSMDGYASATSSVTRDGLKVSLNTKCAEVIIGDLDILKKAPLHLVKAGIGDMLAKYVSICEWRISNIINGEYYCEKTAQAVRAALKKCIDNVEGLLKGDEDAISAVFEGLVLSGTAMAFVDNSRPASGVEHYFSHVWDMRAVEFGTNYDLHGIQCAIGTLKAIEIYNKLKKITPDREKAVQSAKNFDYESYSESLKAFLGKSADGMIKAEREDGRYDLTKHALRLNKIIENWDEIRKVIDEELPPIERLYQVFDLLKLPKTPQEIGIDQNIYYQTFTTTKDIRDKYVLSKLVWDLGIGEEIF